MKNILCPVDFSGYSENVLSLAALLAQNENSTLHIVYVLAVVNYSNLLVADTYLSYSAEIIAEEKKESLQQMEKLKARLEKEHPEQKFTTEIVEAVSAESGILEAAKSLDIDCIVIGSHGRSGFKRLILGSVAESVLREAECNVIVYKAKKGKE